VKRLTQLLLSILVFLTFVGFSGIGSAAVILHDPTWEAPGGRTEISSGISPADIGGKTWSYSNYDPTAYTDLYYVVGDYVDTINWVFTPAGPSIGTINLSNRVVLDYDSSASNLSGGKVIWTDNVAINTSTGIVNLDARFTLSVYDGSSNPLPLIDASTISGMDTRVGGAHHITGDFNANWLFELYNSSSWSPANDVFDDLQTLPLDRLNTSVTRAYYYSPVPIPGAVWLLGSGLVCLVGVRKKLKK